MVKHVEGLTRPPSASDLVLPDGQTLRTKDLGGDPVQARAAIKAGLEYRRSRSIPGRKPGHGIDACLAGPPPWSEILAGKAPGWDLDRVHEWVDESMEFFTRTFPSVPIHTSALHYDETSPHLHILGVPRTASGNLSWKALLQETTGHTNTRIAYTELLDRYHREVGQHFGLDRGEKGTGRRHGRPSEAKKLERERGEVQERADQLDRQAATIKQATRHIRRRSRTLDDREAKAEAEIDAEVERRIAAQRPPAARTAPPSEIDAPEGAKRRKSRLGPLQRAWRAVWQAGGPRGAGRTVFGQAVASLDDPGEREAAVESIDREDRDDARSWVRRMIDAARHRSRGGR